MQMTEATLTFQAPAVNLSKLVATDDAPWTVAAVEALMDLPFTDLMHQAQTIHRQYFDPREVEFATLLSVKTGGCPEDCAYCPQAARYDTGVEATKLMECDEVLVAAKAAKAAGATRFCMGAAWRAPKDRDIEKVAELIRTVKSLGLETCATLGMLEDKLRRWPMPAWIITTTTWTPRPSFTATSSPPATTRTAWTHWSTCAVRASRCVAAVLSGWASHASSAQP